MRTPYQVKPMIVYPVSTLWRKRRGVDHAPAFSARVRHTYDEPLLTPHHSSLDGESYYLIAAMCA